MRINLDSDENIVATLPKVWGNEVGFMGFFKKSKEGILVLTNKRIWFVPKWFFITPREREKYFGGGEAKVMRIDNYSESELDEDISENPKSIDIPLESIVNVENLELRKANFLRIKFKVNGKTKAYDFGIAKTVTNYPIRQPLQFFSMNWGAWIRVIKTYL